MQVSIVKGLKIDRDVFPINYKAVAEKLVADLTHIKAVYEMLEGNSPATVDWSAVAYIEMESFDGTTEQIEIQNANEATTLLDAIKFLGLTND